MAPGDPARCSRASVCADNLKKNKIFLSAINRKASNANTSVNEISSTKTYLAASDCRPVQHDQRHTIEQQSLSNKVVEKTELLTRVAIARKAGRTIAHCHGCFDIVHPGHIRHLEFARRQGDVVVVSITGDAQIDKGDQRPYVPQELRAESLAALEAVDWVYTDPHSTSCELLRELRPDVYIKGHEYEHSNDPKFAAEQAIVNAYGGRVVFSSGDVVFSSTSFIESLDQDTSLEQQRLRLFCARYGITTESINSTLRSFAKLRVLIVGDVVVDRYVLCDATNLASEAPMISLSRLAERVFVGGAGIVARHAAGLGAKTYLLSTTARNTTSDNIQQTLETDAINTKLIPCRERLPEKTRYLVDTSKLLRVEDAHSTPLDSVAETEAVNWIESIADTLDAVIFCDFGYGTITGGLLERLRSILNQRSLVVAADVSEPHGQLLQFRDATLLCPTEREVRSALHDFESGLSNVAWNALDQTQARHMIATLGKKGLVVFDRQSQDPTSSDWRGRLRSEYVASLAENVVDPLGCGDALLATATLTMAAHGGLMQAAYLGTAAAAIEIARLGNIPINLAILQHYLNDRPELAKQASSQDKTATAIKFTSAAAPIATAPRVPEKTSDNNDLLGQLLKQHDQKTDRWRPNLPDAHRKPGRKPIPPIRRRPPSSTDERQPQPQGQGRTENET